MNEKFKYFADEILETLKNCKVEFKDLHAAQCFYSLDGSPNILIGEYSPNMKHCKLPGKPSQMFISRSSFDENKKVLKVLWVA